MPPAPEGEFEKQLLKAGSICKKELCKNRVLKLAA
jgi:hypothetical protein